MEAGAAAPMVNVLITTAFNSFSTERRFASDHTIGQLKNLLEGLTGASPSSMQLTLLKKDGTLVGALSNDGATLQQAGIQNGMTIKVTDPSVRVGEFEDLSNVKKFELSDEAYADRSESLRAFKQRNKMGQFDEEKQKELKEEEAKKEAEAQHKTDAMQVGNRCLVTVVGQPHKKGTVMYKGTASFKPGLWVGVKYDEPLGKHDGSVDGKRYFECPPKYGAFVRPEHVEVGDYPEDDILQEI
ncbi:hypothetical protein RvY_17197 [Ramazzottius varieornatus]|uniref:CAP-Gly domain-containing protein n=1 Tax=Ramazzottius varieornatus TaxID=947166 RepID=A0A1D1W5A9_RAMVA|nr:hypothetical protein RvY_17197 [Ramazzottius varieornatus]